MDDAFTMGGSKPVGHLRHDVDGFGDLQLAAFLQQLMEVLALQVLHRDELRFPGFANIENADYVAVRHLAREDQLLLKTLQNLRVIGQFRLDYFERNFSPQFDVSSLVYGAHAAFAEQFQKLITLDKQIAYLELTCVRSRINRPARRRWQRPPPGWNSGCNRGVWIRRLRMEINKRRVGVHQCFVGIKSWSSIHDRRIRIVDRRIGIKLRSRIYNRRIRIILRRLFWRVRNAARGTLAGERGSDARRARRFRHRLLIRLPEISHFDFSEPEA